MSSKKDVPIPGWVAKALSLKLLELRRMWAVRFISPVFFACFGHRLRFVIPSITHCFDSRQIAVGNSFAVSERTLCFDKF